MNIILQFTRVKWEQGYFKRWFEIAGDTDFYVLLITCHLRGGKQIEFQHRIQMKPKNVILPIP